MTIATDGTCAGLDLLTRDDVLRILKLSRASLYVIMHRDGFPRPVKVASTNRWYRHEVVAWLEGQASARETAGVA